MQTRFALWYGTSDCWLARKQWSLQGLRRKVARLDDCVDFVQRVATGAPEPDMLMRELVRLYSEELPTEEETRVLSLLQQSACGTNGLEEYAATTMWLSAIHAIMRREETRLRRAQSAPASVFARDAFFPPPLARARSE